MNEKRNPVSFISTKVSNSFFFPAGEKALLGRIFFYLNRKMEKYIKTPLSISFAFLLSK